MDIPDYLTNPNVDGHEWIKRKVLGLRWDLRQIIEEIEFLAEQYQMKKKYHDSPEELKQIEFKLKQSFEQGFIIAKQISDFSIESITDTL